MLTYAEFIAQKSQSGERHGFAPLWMPDFLFDFQKHLVEWALRRGRAAIFAGTGLGKTPMQLVWAENIVRKTNRPVLILAPLAVSAQTVDEGAKFSMEVERSREGNHGGGIVITNYERLHHFKPEDFAAVVCDESSCLKHFTGATQKSVTRFMSKVPYRLLCTATAAPHDYIELGTSSEALGELGHTDMLSRFFKQDETKKHRLQDVKNWRSDQEHNTRAARGGNHFAKLSFRVSQSIGQWRLKGHAVQPFWRWVASWARACRMPSDLGFPDDGFVLPPLIEHEHIIEPMRPPDGMLFTLPAFGLRAERDERRRTMEERIGLVSDLVAQHDLSIVWCHLNAEGDMLEDMLPHSLQVAGRHDDDYKEKAVEWFLGKRCLCDMPRFRTTGCGHGADGPRRLISKSRIFGYGLNLQCCAHVVAFVSHSWEQHYQSIRRCWRFGQKRPVTVDIIATTGEQYVSENMARKATAADAMFVELVSHMGDANRIVAVNACTRKEEVPSWL